MDDLIELAKLAGAGATAEAILRQALSSKRMRDNFRRCVLVWATDEERILADFALAYSGSDVPILCAIASRHAEDAI